jgi:hypothetical protein
MGKRETKTLLWAIFLISAAVTSSSGAEEPSTGRTEGNHTAIHRNYTVAGKQDVTETSNRDKIEIESDVVSGLIADKISYPIVNICCPLNKRYEDGKCVKRDNGQVDTSSREDVEEGPVSKSIITLNEGLEGLNMTDIYGDPVNFRYERSSWEEMLCESYDENYVLDFIHKLPRSHGSQFFTST